MAVRILFSILSIVYSNGILNLHAGKILLKLETVAV